MSCGPKGSIWTHPRCKDCFPVTAQDKTANVYPAYQWGVVAALALMVSALFHLIGFSAPKASTLFRFQKSGLSRLCHHSVSAPAVMDGNCGHLIRITLCASLGRASIRCLSRHQRPQDPDILVRDRHTRPIGASPTLQAGDPAASRVSLRSRANHHGARPMDQECTQIAVTTLRDA